MKSILKKFLKLYKRFLRLYRQKKLLKLVKSHKGSIFIGGPTRLTNNTILNENPNFNGMTIKGRGEVIIGDNFHSGQGCLIHTEYHNYSSGKAIPYDNTFIIKDVIIGDNVWVGDRVIILGGVKIGEGAIIQAGAVVVRDIPELGIAGGNPASVFKYRDKEHYYSLKEKKCFF